MCVWPFVLHVHATGTSGQHGSQRRQYTYAEVCSQCGSKLTAHTHVAAHVISYPCYCCNCCLGILSLKTTCKKCNNANKLGKRHVNEHSCMACSARREPNISPKLKFVCQPFCCHYQLAAVAPEPADEMARN